MSLQEQIIRNLYVKPEINPEEEMRRSIEFMKEYLYTYSFCRSFVLGISGGQDSTLAGKLAQMAILEMREETGKDYQFIAIRLPYGKQADEVDALKAIDFIQPDQSLSLNIQPAVDAAVETLQNSGIKINDFNKGNMKARQRMLMQYAVAGEYQGVVIGTDHAAENVTGFFTKYGDGGADILPLFRLNKRQGKQLLKYLGANPELYEKEPTADLEDDKPLLADEVALGVTYDAIDDYLEGRKVSEKDRKTIESWWKKSEHKRHLPITIYDDFWKKDVE